jgi:hypothetical protein
VALFGAVPERFKKTPGSQVDLDTYFAMARGLQEKDAEHQQQVWEIGKEKEEVARGEMSLIIK